MFTTREIARLTELDRGQILAWMRRGWLSPKVRGRPGYGGDHKWSYQQAIGLAIIAGSKAYIWSLGNECVTSVMGDMEKVTDGEMEAWLGPPGDPWTDEIGAKAEAIGRIAPIYH